MESEVKEQDDCQRGGGKRENTVIYSGAHRGAFMSVLTCKVHHHTGNERG
jgi:hypothetical protein